MENSKNPQGSFRNLKNSILVITAITFGLLNVNAKNLKTTLNTSIVKTSFTKSEFIEVFDWNIKTTNGEYSGTALTLSKAKRMINLTSIGETIIEEKITSYYVLKSEINSKQNRIYFWEVNTKSGHAKGFSFDKHTAKKMIDLVAKGEIISYEIIASGELK